MKQPYNTALYYRLSRDDENFGDSVSIETQRTILQQFARDNQFHVVDEYIDDGWSGTNFDRPAFQRKTTDIWFDEKDPLIHIRTHNTNLKKRLAAYAEQYPDECCKTDTDPETGCMEFDIAKGRFSFRLTAPYSEERREAARRYAKENNVTDRLK